MRLILASASPYRAELLQRLGLAFEQLPVPIDETPRASEDPAAYVERLAIGKAQAVLPLSEPTLIIGCDQAALLDGEIIGKAETAERATAQLCRASGRRLEFVTGLALINSATGAVQSDVVPSRVHFRRLAKADIERYVERERPLDCAGSIKTEGLGIALLQCFEADDPTALIGLPLIRLTAMLAAQGVHLP